MPTLVIATRNAHKVQEIQAVLGPRFICQTLEDHPDAPSLVETGATFADNARQKAKALAGWLLDSTPVPGSGVWAVLADDSGLEVDALCGAPGVHSARFAAAEFGLTGNAPDGANNSKLLRALAGVPEDRRTARFRCVLALAAIGDSAVPSCFDGVCEGQIGIVQRGAAGFGYDPLFTPHGFSETFAELGATTKNRISHRAQALARLQQALASPSSPISNLKSRI